MLDQVDQYINAYNRGLVSTDHPHFEAVSTLVSMMDECADLYKAIEGALYERDERGFYVDNSLLIGEYERELIEVQKLISYLRKEFSEELSNY